MSNNPYLAPNTNSLPNSVEVDSPTSIRDILFSFEGRINRLKFWICLITSYVLISATAGLMTPIILTLRARANETAAQSAPLLTILILFFLLLVSVLWVHFAITVKRYHDVNKSATWLFIVLIPILGPIGQLIECGFRKGTTGPNSYGTDPLQ